MRLARPVLDYYVLRSLGFSEEEAALLVKRRHGLDKSFERLLKRCVHPPRDSQAVEAKLVGDDDVKGSWVCIDGYNQALTVYAALRKGYVYRCTDGILRDDLAGAGKTDAQLIEIALKALAMEAAALGVARLYVVLDARVPRSGELAAGLRRAGVKAFTSRKTDTTLLHYAARGCIIASSDRVVALKAPRVLDLAARVVKRIGARIIDLQGVVAAELASLCRELQSI